MLGDIKPEVIAVQKQIPIGRIRPARRHRQCRALPRLRKRAVTSPARRCRLRAAGADRPWGRSPEQSTHVATHDAKPRPRPDRVRGYSHSVLRMVAEEERGRPRRRTAPRIRPRRTPRPDTATRITAPGPGSGAGAPRTARLTAAHRSSARRAIRGDVAGRRHDLVVDFPRRVGGSGSARATARGREP